MVLHLLQANAFAELPQNYTFERLQILMLQEPYREPYVLCEGMGHVLEIQRFPHPVTRTYEFSVNDVSQLWPLCPPFPLHITLAQVLVTSCYPGRLQELLNAFLQILCLPLPNLVRLSQQNKFLDFSSLPKSLCGFPLFITTSKPSFSL